jgi:phage repressor protein C with HTH and peptisase S24 domain
VRELNGVPVVGEIREAAVTALADVADQPAGSPKPLTVTPDTPFALSVADASLEPAYSRGNVLFLSPKEPFRAGDRVVVKAEGMQPLPRLLVTEGPVRIELVTFRSSRKPLLLDRASIEWIARIMWARQ